MTRLTRRHEAIIVEEDEVPSHLLDEREPEIRVRRYVWSTSRSGLGGFLMGVLGVGAFLGALLFALLGLGLFLLGLVAFFLLAALRSIFSVSGRGR